MKEHVFVGFGFGPIQSGLFVSEAFNSGNFKRIVIAEIDQKLVDAVRANNGTYFVNVATSDSIITERIKGIEIYNPTVDDDRRKLFAALSEATEIVTSLPSVNFYDMGDTSVAKLITAGLKDNSASGTIIYTAENNNHAAEILEEIIVEKYPTVKNKKVQFINTVIGKMSQVVTDAAEIKEKKLTPLAPGIDRAFLVEQFNKILVTKCNIPDFKPGIEVFIEKDDLLPFEEAKLYGHNAIHFLLALLGLSKGYKKMAELKDDAELMQIARDAFLNESGAALIKKYESLNDELFTEAGFKVYAEDLLDRIVNPYLDDTIERAARDPQRKLGPNDRIFGTIALCLEQGIEPKNMSLGAAAGVKAILKEQGKCQLPKELQFDPSGVIGQEKIKQILDWLWGNHSLEHSD
jgi:mannitol-1-phosphate 5-dehydrogenase